MKSRKKLERVNTLARVQYDSPLRPETLLGTLDYSTAFAIAQ